MRADVVGNGEVIRMGRIEMSVIRGEVKWE